MCKVERNSTIPTLCKIEITIDFNGQFWISRSTLSFEYSKIERWALFKLHQVLLWLPWIRQWFLSFDKVCKAAFKVTDNSFVAVVMLLPCVLASAATSRFRCRHYFLDGHLSGCFWLFVQNWWVVGTIWGDGDTQTLPNSLIHLNIHIMKVWAKKQPQMPLWLGLSTSIEITCNCMHVQMPNLHTLGFVWVTSFKKVW